MLHFTERHAEGVFRDMCVGGKGGGCRKYEIIVSRKFLANVLFLRWFQLFW